jgi:hypothetical protein
MSGRPSVRRGLLLVALTALLGHVCALETEAAHGLGVGHTRGRPQASRPVWRRALLVLVLLVGLAILNGAAREAVLSPRLGGAAGHVVSSILLAGLIALTASLTIRWIAPGTVRRAWAVGVLWLSLTVAFEFQAGHYAFGHPWPRLLADYDILRGRVWVLVLVATLVTPAWAWRARTP